MRTQEIRYALYARKSSEPDDRQALSISSQTRECASKFPEITPREAIEESFSAKAPGRPLFNALIELVERGEVDGIIAWHPDRLARNSVDSGKIIYLLDTGKLKDLKFCSYTFENTPEGKWMLSMVMSQAKYQVDKLSVEVLRGNREKYEAGGITWRAPQGYIHNPITGEIEPDTVRFSLVRRMWDMLLSQAYTVPQIHHVAVKDWGYLTRKTQKSGDRPIALSMLYLLFRNPLYCGLNVRPDGTVYECKHQPMVTVDEFWRAQKILGKKGRPKPKSELPSPYTDRLIRCAECGCSFTIDRKLKHLKNGKVLQFTYCRCTKKRGVCSQRHVPLHDLEDQLIGGIGPIPMSISCWRWVAKFLNQRAAEEMSQVTAVSLAQEKSHETIESELANLKVMLRKGYIEEHEFIEQRAELLGQLPSVKQREKSKEPAWLEPALNALKFGFRCCYWFVNGDAFVKKTVITTIGGSNLSIQDKKLNFQPVGPFDIMARQAEYATWYTFAEDIRTYFQDETHQALVPTLKPIPEEAEIELAKAA